MTIINDETMLRCKGCGLTLMASIFIKIDGEYRFPKTYGGRLPEINEDRFLLPSYRRHCPCDKDKNKALAFFNGENLRLNEEFAEVVK